MGRFKMMKFYLVVVVAIAAYCVNEVASCQFKVRGSTRPTGVKPNLIKKVQTGSIYNLGGSHCLSYCLAAVADRNRKPTFYGPAEAFATEVKTIGRIDRECWCYIYRDGNIPKKWVTNQNESGWKYVTCE